MLSVPLGSFFKNDAVIAAGATLGIEHFHSILEMFQMAPDTIEMPLALDFAGIEDATPSYLKATLLALHQCGRLYGNALSADELLELEDKIVPVNITVVVTNASQAVQDCIHEVLARRNLAILAGTKPLEDRLENAVLLGKLDGVLVQTLTAACNFSEFQAADLHRGHDGAAISVTGWNNRLAELHRQRLVRKRIEGRTNRFFPLANRIISYGPVLSAK